MIHSMRTLLSIALLFALGRPALAQQIKWTDLQEAQALNAKKPKKYFVDLYTDWCGYCKKMDRTTLRNAQLAQFLNARYYPVKFNAEQRKNIYWNGRMYKYRSNGYQGFNELALYWLRGQMGFPAYLVVSADGKTVEKRLIGFHTPMGLNLQLID